MSEIEEARRALARARVPAGALSDRLKTFGPDCVKLHKQLDALDGEDLTEFFRSGRGWIVQGAPVKALAAFHCIVKACLLLGQSAVCVDGLGKQLVKPFDDGRTEVEDARVLGVRRFYDASYKAFPFDAETRFEAEAAFMQQLGEQCTPVLHCTGRFNACDWYSADLMELVLQRCDIITVGK